jgi:hypothetical protein
VSEAAFVAGTAGAELCSAAVQQLKNTAARIASGQLQRHPHLYSVDVFLILPISYSLFLLATPAESLTALSPANVLNLAGSFS